MLRSGMGECGLLLIRDVCIDSQALDSAIPFSLSMRVVVNTT